MRRNAQELRDNFKTSLIAALGRELDADTLRMATAVFKKRKFVDSSQVVRRRTEAWWCWQTWCEVLVLGARFAVAWARGHACR